MDDVNATAAVLVKIGDLSAVGVTLHREQQIADAIHAGTLAAEREEVAANPQLRRGGAVDSTGIDSR